MKNRELGGIREKGFREEGFRSVRCMVVVVMVVMMVMAMAVAVGVIVIVVMVMVVVLMAMVVIIMPFRECIGNRRLDGSRQRTAGSSWRPGIVPLIP